MAPQPQRKVLMLAPVHRPWGNRVIRESETLVENGYYVKAMMNTTNEHLHHGINIIPGPTYKSRLVRFLKIPLVFWKAYKTPVDIYHLHNPDMLPVAFALTMIGKAVIYDTHEDFSRRLHARNWLPRPLRQPLAKVIEYAEKKISQKAAQTFVTQPHLVDKYGGRSRLLQNAPKTSRNHLAKIEVLSSDIPEPTVVQLVYVGSLSAKRGILTMLDALIICNEQKDVRLWLAGQEMDGILEQAKAHPGWHYVDFLGLLPHEKALAYVKKAAFGLAVLEDIGDHRDARPTKIFEYMSVGTSFIASDFPKWHQFLKAKDIGTWIEPANSKILSAAILEKYADQERLVKSEDAGLLHVSEFNWGNESKVLLEVYAAIS